MSANWNAESLIGSQLGSCVLERPLGVGGMGAVYLARQERPHRQVAVKVLRPAPTADPRGAATFLARFRREADATASLDHGNIVPIYEFGELDGVAYLVMPYLSAGSLADLLKRHGPLSVERTLAYVAQIGAALDYAHSQGIIHRDVKPSNVLLHPDGRLLLADFGIARPLDRADAAEPLEDYDDEDDNPTLTRGGAVLGTPQYMAPEQITGDPVGPATDLYALGVLAYTLLAGRPPFEGDTGEVMRRQVNERPPSLRPLRPDVPSQMEVALFRALAKRPDDRPRSAGAFAASLREAALSGSRPLRTAPPTVAIGGPSGSTARARRSGALRPTDAAFAVASVGATRPSTSLNDEPSTDDDHDAPTIYDGVFAESSSRSMSSMNDGASPPLWPGRGSGGAPPPDGSGPMNRRSLLTLAGGALIALVVLAALVSGNGLFSHATVLGKPSASATRAATPTATITPTRTPTPSPTPIGDWLRLSTGTVNLTCHGETHQAQITLKNIGPSSISWFAFDDGGGFFGDGLTVKPAQGSLRSGQSVTITLSNAGYTDGSGTLSFQASDGRAGDPATLDFSTQSC